MSLTDEQLQELRDLAAVATPGPWNGCAHVAGTDDACPCRYRGDVHSEATGEVIVQMRVGPDEHPGAPDDDSWKGLKTTDMEQGYVNGRFIAAADPPTVLALVNEVERLRAENYDLNERVERLAEALVPSEALAQAFDAVRADHSGEAF